jgi:hypothetical protein
MFRLIQSNFAAARKPDGGDYTPPLLVNFRAHNFLSLEPFDGCRQIVAHEVELRVEKFIPARFCIGRMHGELGWRQCEYQPSVAGIHRTEREDVGKERSIRIRVFAVEENVGAVDHAEIVS